MNGPPPSFPPIPTLPRNPTPETTANTIMNPATIQRPGRWRASACAAAAFVLSLWTAAPASADYLSTVLSQGPVGYWRLEETVQPQPPINTAKNLGSLGTAGDGTYLGSMVRGEAGALAGSTATSVRFQNDGFQVGRVSGVSDVDYQAALNPNGPFTVEFWAKPSAVPPDLFCPVASLDANAGRSGYLFYAGVPSAGTPARWEFRVGDTTGYRGTAAGGTVTGGAWHHVVGVYDGSAVTLYVNGSAVATTNVPGFSPNTVAPFRIGATTIPNREWDGHVQEVAFYGTALSASDVAAHYAKGTGDGNGYPALVLAGKPVGYWRLGEAPSPTLPVAANAGTLGATGNGSYVFGSNPGQSGPSGPDFPGFPAGNRSVGLSGTEGHVTLPALNLNTNTVTITAWVHADATQAKNSGIVFTRSDSTVAGLKFDSNDPNGLGYNWADIALAANFKSSLTVPQSRWAFVALAVHPDVATLAVHDGTAFNFANNYDVANLPQPFDAEWRIGNDPASTNTFVGSIDEVAIFNRALSLGEIYTQYASAVGGLPPQVFADPVAASSDVSAGEPIVLSVDAGGTPNLTYQWRRNNSPIPGATGPTYSKASAALGDTGSYDVVVTNPHGTVTSLATSINVIQVSPPAITSMSGGRTLYPGGTLSLSVVATGGRLSYAWSRDDKPIAGATGATYTVAGATGADSGTYTVRVSNTAGSATSDPAVVTVVVPPAGSYEAKVAADGPQAWWRLRETAGSGTLFDSMGRHDGVYVGNGAKPGSPGVLKSGAGTAATFDGTASYGRIPYSPLLNARTNWTVEVWARTADSGTELSPLASFSLTAGSGRGYGFMKTTADEWWGLTGNNDQYNYYYAGLGPVRPSSWSHLVIVGGASGVSFYMNGRFVDGPFTSYVRNVSAPLIIGGRNNDGAIRQFWKGDIAEVAYYAKVLSADQIRAHYTLALYGDNSAPVFIEQPVALTQAFGRTARFSATVEGTEPIRLQWTRDGVPIPNATNSTLSLTNLDFVDAGAYRLEASNPVSKATSDPAALAVVPEPVFANVSDGLVLHLGFDADFKDSSGRGNHATAVGAPTLVSGVIGAKALHYSSDADASAYNYLTLGVPADLQFGTSTDFSVSYWVKLPKGSLSGDLPFLCNAVNSYSNPGYTFAPSYQLGGWSWSLGSADIYGDDGSINDGNWHHLLHTFSRTGKGTTYLDGVQVDSRPVTAGGNLDTGDPTNIGQDPSGEYPETGEATLDDLGVWRRALTPFEAWTIYHVGKTYGASFDSTNGPVKITVREQADGRQELVWSAGVLQSGPSINGPWSNVPGATRAPYFIDPAGDGAFYRVAH